MRPRIVLASASPRRRELLDRLGLDADVQPADVDETPRPGETATDLVRRLAAAKASDPDVDPDVLVIGADTVVTLGSAILTKPVDRSDAASMLSSLSGRTHHVVSGVAIAHRGQLHTATDTTRVTFRSLTDAEIDWYVQTGEPGDKAGAYGLQGAGAALVDTIDGSHTTVMGLPLSALLTLTRTIGIDLLGQPEPGADPGAPPFAAILVAAGAGRRLQTGGPKALVEVGGRPLVAHGLDRLARAGADTIAVVAPPDAIEATTAVLPRVAATVVVVPGGRRRADSVRAGLTAVPVDATRIAVHDAARGLAPADLIARVVAAVTGDVVAAAPSLPVPDTLKRVDGDRVVATVDRTPLVAVQTPQVFRAACLRHAHATAGDATDDLALVEAAVRDGTVTGRVVVVPGDARAMKVTRPGDLVVAAAFVAAGR